MSPAILHKDSGFAVGDAKWYVAECKPTRERTIRAMLQKTGYEAYVASQVETHVYKSRNRREVERVVIPGRIFIRTEERNLMLILLEYSSVYRFLINRAARLNGKGLRPYACVPEAQMRQLQYVLGHAENPVHVTAEDLKVNQKVRVMRGPLAGLEAYFKQIGRSSYIVVKMEMGTCNYVYTEVPLEDVQLE